MADAQRLIKKEKEEKTGKLDLGNCGLTEIPEEVFDLKWLEELSFCNRRYNFKHSKILESDNKGEPNKIGTKILPQKFKNLKNLKKFYYGGDSSQEKWRLVNCSILSKLCNLKILYIGFSQIRNINSLKNLTELNILDLRANKINEITPLKYISNLYTLILGENYITDIKPLDNLTKLNTLRLWNNKITKINALENLTELNDIDLGGNKITDLKPLKYLTELNNLILGQNKITNLHPLENLTKLDTLHLWDNQITDIKPLRNLIYLNELHLEGNKIFRIKPIKNLTELNVLSLSKNKISNISPLENLSTLNTLKLSRNNISDIQSLKNLTELKTLYLNSNKIRDIQPLENLTELNDLNLRYNQISDIKPLENLTELKTLYLNSNKIRDIQPLENLTHLSHLHLSANNITDIKPLENLNKLNELGLDVNKISNIKPLENLTELNDLNLRYNQISDIKPLLPLLKSRASIGKTKYINTITIGDNPIEKPPMSIVEEGREAIINYFEQAKEGEKPLYESKLMILGQPGAGKTTLAQLLLDEDYEVKPGKLKSTLGIKIHEGRKFQHRKIEEQEIKTHLWDFGGQDIQKMLHQFFITENCLYILVSDKRAENTNFNYWFQTIKLLGPESNVIVLENPKDIEANAIDFALTKYKELFPKLNITRHEMDLSKIQEEDRKEWEAFKSDIEKQLTALEIVNREVPQKWTLVRDELEQLAGEKHITKDKFYEICSKEGINLNKEQADLCLFYLKSLGDLVYFDEIGLSNCIFLDHNWLTKGMYYILSDNQIKENNGRFTREQAYKYWGDEGYKESEKEMLLNLLLKDKFDLCYELKDEKDTFITPLLLPDDKPESWNYNTNLYFRFQYQFFPHGIFSRLIVRLHQKIEEEKRWKSGVRLIDKINNEKVRAEVQKLTEPDSNQKVVDIKISGTKEASKELLNYIRYEINHLHNEFNDLTPNKFVGCNCDTCRQLMENNKKPYFHNYNKLTDKISQRNYFEECDKAGYKKINIGKILNNVVIEDSAKNKMDNKLLYNLKEMGISINQIINKQNQNVNQRQNTTQTTNVETNIDITIKNELPKIQNEFADFADYIYNNFPEFERRLNRIEDNLDSVNQNSDTKELNKPMNKLGRFLQNLGDEDSKYNKIIQGTEQGLKYAKQLGSAYSKVADFIPGLPTIPRIFTE